MERKHGEAYIDVHRMRCCNREATAATSAGLQPMLTHEPRRVIDDRTCNTRSHFLLCEMREIEHNIMLLL
jgi:hypothetical protein